MIEFSTCPEIQTEWAQGVVGWNYSLTRWLMNREKAEELGRIGVEGALKVLRNAGREYQPVASFHMWRSWSDNSRSVAQGRVLRSPDPSDLALLLRAERAGEREIQMAIHNTPRQAAQDND